MIRLIASDLDGTLLSPDNKLNPEFFQVLSELRKRDIMFVAASGRGYTAMNHYFSDVLDDIHIVSSNGAMMIKGDKIIHVEPMDSVPVKAIYNLINEYEDLVFTASTTSGVYVFTDSDDSFNYIHKHYGKRYARAYDLNILNSEILQCGLFHITDTLRIKEDLFSKLSIDELKNIKYMSSGDQWIDILNMNVNKGRMLKRLQDDYGISSAETMAFGDYDNDLEMFDHAQYGYAMENAQDVVKRRANYVCASNAKNGVLEKIKEIVEINL